MPKFDPIRMQYATLGKGEQHLHSFAGQNCVWQDTRSFFLFGEITGYFPRVPTVVFFYRGHLTNQRLILELPKKPNALVWAIIKILGEASGTRVGQLVGAISDDVVHTSDEVQRLLQERKYMEFQFDNIQKVMCYENSIFWAVGKDDPIGLGVPFVPRYIDNEGYPDGGTMFSNDDDVGDFSTIVSSLLTLEHIDESIKV